MRRHPRRPGWSLPDTPTRGRRSAWTRDCRTLTRRRRQAERGIQERAAAAISKQEFARADVQVKETYSTPFQTHSPMEPHATIAVWDGTEKLTLYDTSQGIFGDRKRVADLLGLQPENIRVVSLFLGGGFGSKGPCWSHTMLCAMAARQVKRPVKLVLRRPQMFGPVGCRSATRQIISVGAQSDGKLAALRNETISHTSTFDEFTETATLPARMLYSVAKQFDRAKAGAVGHWNAILHARSGRSSGDFRARSGHG